MMHHLFQKYMYFSKQKKCDFMHDQMGNNRHIKNEVTLQAFAYFKYIYIVYYWA